MLTQPNQYTLTENGIVYGLHTFKDGVNPTVICQLHPSGEWITLAPATEQQIKHFAAYGTKATPAAERRNNKPLPVEEHLPVEAIE
jgi:hypothetical protein